MKNNDGVSSIGVLIILAITIYTVWWSWSYLNNQLDSTVFAVLLTIPLSVIIFWGLNMVFSLTLILLASLFRNNR